MIEELRPLLVGLATETKAHIERIVTERVALVEKAFEARLVALEARMAAVRDGAPGRDGRDGAPGPAGEPGRIGEKGDRGEAGQQGMVGPAGETGANGQDGLGIDNLDVVYDQERTFTFRWAAGEKLAERSFVVPMLIDRGIHQAGRSYQTGDAVTRAGALWAAKADTAETPGEGATSWRLVAKRGAEGKPGQPGPPGPPGQRGETGPQGRSGF